MSKTIIILKSYKTHYTTTIYKMNDIFPISTSNSKRVTIY